jgi:hypothetical protein
LTRELLATGYIHSCHDFCRVAAHLQAGRSRDQILAMEELGSLARGRCLAGGEIMRAAGYLQRLTAFQQSGPVLSEPIARCSYPELSHQLL